MAIMVIFMCANFVACDNDDDNIKSYEELLIGTWKHTEGVGALFTFHSDGTGKTHKEGDEESESPFTWELNNTHININHETYKSIMVIKEISETTMLITDKKNIAAITFIRIE